MKNKLGNAVWGLFIILIGVGIAGNELNLWDFNFFFDGWWTLFIIIPCFVGMIKSNFGVGSTIGFLIGVLLFLSHWVDFNFNPWSLLIPAIIIYIGLRIMFQDLFTRRHFHGDKTVHNGFQTGQEGSTFHSSNKSEYTAIFSSNNIRINHEPFNGTNLNAIFGSIVLDLRDAVIQNDVEISASAVFAGIEIYAPSGVKIKVNNVPIFGGVSNKYVQNAGAGAPIIYLNSTCMFGGIDIK
ncbi:MAG: putative rane protein [Herbinix sp.]|jgi:predicted membrane protein|nr:putative rane protein [Herbinix sp.]